MSTYFRTRHFDKLIKSDWFHLNIGGGITGGYESIPKLSDSGIFVTDSGGFRYGFGAKLQPEFKITKIFSVYIEPKYNYLINANNPSQFLGAVGFKFYLN